MDHVAFIRPEPLDALYSGQKEFEIRLSKRRSCIMQVSAGDRCLIKRSGGSVEASTRIEEAATFDELSPPTVESLRGVFGSGLNFECEYWRRHRNANYAVIIRFGDFIPASLPEKYTPTGIQLGWVANFEHFGEAHLERQIQQHPQDSGGPCTQSQP